MTNKTPLENGLRPKYQPSQMPSAKQMNQSTLHSSHGKDAKILELTKSLRRRYVGNNDFESWQNLTLLKDFTCPNSCEMDGDIVTVRYMAMRVYGPTLKMMVKINKYFEYSPYVIRLGVRDFGSKLS